MEQKPRKISNFHLTRSLYSGSKTEVHQGRFAQAGGVVQLSAVKVLRPRFACIGHELRAFLAEAGWATELRSTLFPRVFEAGEHEGNYFIAMEFVDGWTLARVLGSLATLQVPLPCEVGLSIASQLAAGLHKMHERREHDEPMGIVHLGLNPENIMLSKDGQARLLDFGMTLAAVDRELTEPDDKAVEFQSPEHCRGLPVDRRADVFSLGRVLQHMVQCMVPDAVRSDLPALIARACHNHPEQRFSDMKDFNGALRLIAQNRDLDPTRAACEKFTLEIFGHKVAKTDPRARRPQPAVPLMRSSEGQKTSYEPVTPPPQAHLPRSPQGNLTGEGEATAVGEVMDGKATVMGGMEDSSASTMRDLSDGKATVMGGMEDSSASTMRDLSDGKATVMGGMEDSSASTMRDLAAGKATTMGEMFDPKATTVGEHEDIEATTEGEVYRELPTVVGAAFDPHATTAGELADSMLTVPGGAVHGTATSVGAAPERPKFVDAHLAVTTTGGSAAPPAPAAAPTPAAAPSAPVDDESQEVTAFSVPAVGDSEKPPAKGGFREELIPTKPYASHDGEDGA